MEVMRVIEDINQKLGTTIIMATHDKEIVNRMKKRVIVIEKGLVKKDNQKGRYRSEGI
jgi:cell division transport system ATP-binding protein